MDMSALPAFTAISQNRVELERHAGFSRVFRPSELTVGLILPLESHPDSPAPTMQGHVEMAQRAERAGIAALWMRDIPFYDPAYGDVGQIFDPLVYIAYLASATTRIALGTTGIVLPIREPIILAKQANSLDRLSGGRFILGFSSGDRPSEYPLFGVDFQTRGERYREVFELYRSLSETAFPSYASSRFGTANGVLDMVPKPLHGRIPAIAVGRAQQSLEWIAARMDGLLDFVPEPSSLPSLAKEWRALASRSNDGPVFKPLALGGFLYLHPKPDYPFKRIKGGFAIGSRALKSFFEQAREAGVNHVALNAKITPRPYSEILDELESEVLPAFAV
jgi:luciferase-type oxidoreductase